MDPGEVPVPRGALRVPLQRLDQRPPDDCRCGRDGLAPTGGAEAPGRAVGASGIEGEMEAARVGQQFPGRRHEGAGLRVGPNRHRQIEGDRSTLTDDLGQQILAVEPVVQRLADRQKRPGRGWECQRPGIGSALVVEKIRVGGLERAALFAGAVEDELAVPAPQHRHRRPPVTPYASARVA